MTIAFFNSIPTWGGGEKWHFETSSYFANKGYDVYFFANPKGILFKKLQGTKVKLIPVELGNLSFLNPFKLLKLKRTFSKHNIDLVVINHPGDLKIAAYAAHLAKVPRIIYRRGSAIPIKDRFLNRLIFKNFVTDILANSIATKETILQNNSSLFDINKIEVIYNHIDIDEFVKREYTALTNTDNQCIKIGALGRLAPEKNHRFLIDISKKLKSKGVNHHIYIAGTGRLEQELKEYSKQQQTDDCVSFIGFQNNVKNLLHSIDIFILPSLWEGFGYALAEASLCNKPIIAFNLASMPEVVVNGKSGYLVQKNDLNETIKYIELLSDSNLRDKMGQFGFDYCTKTFERNQIMKQIENYFNR